MPKVHRVKARKDAPKICPRAKAGDVYYWWKNRVKGQKEGTFKCTVGVAPKRSQLTMSEYVSSVLQIQEDMDSASFDDVGDFEAARDEWAQQIRDLAAEQDDKLYNMPDQLQESDTGYLLEERRDALEAWADEVEQVTVDEPEVGHYNDVDEYRETLEEAIQEALNACAAGCPE